MLEIKPRLAVCKKSSLLCCAITPLPPFALLNVNLYVQIFRFLKVIAENDLAEC